ncbi:hypothetical protein KY285_009833 [Solanum tuberosum]|nr:hypothetical protein KY285_009833 [Solanum tuberosum]
MFADIHRDEVRAMLQQLLRGKTSGGNTNVVDMKAAFFEMILNILMMIAGKNTMVILLGNWRNQGGVNKLENKVKLLQEKRDKFMQELIEEHKNRQKGSSLEQKNNTMIDVLLSLQDSEPDYYTDEVIKGMGIVMLTAGTDTTASTMEWTLSFLLNNPEALKKAQNEIDTHLGESSRLLDDSDLAQLPYLHGIINETLRLCPATPLLVPHESSDECVVGGFRVPRGTMLLVNLWAIQNDAKLWDRPNEFRPERFIDIIGQQDGFRQKQPNISKLHHRRQCRRPDIEITNSQFQPIIIPSPSTRPNERASPSIEMINKVEEEKAIKERRFYLHPSPRSKHGNAEEPELLTLFPLISPR